MYKSIFVCMYICTHIHKYNEYIYIYIKYTCTPEAWELCSAAAAATAAAGGTAPAAAATHDRAKCGPQ